jgi:intergrase/recombinase
MAYCRKIFATYLRTHGIEQEIIDLLQGMAPRSVLPAITLNKSSKRTGKDYCVFGKFVSGDQLSGLIL